MVSSMCVGTYNGISYYIAVLHTRNKTLIACKVLFVHRFTLQLHCSLQIMLKTVLA